MMKAWFVNCMGKTFAKVFGSSDELEKFMDRAGTVGTKILGFVSL